MPIWMLLSPAVCLGPPPADAGGAGGTPPAKVVYFAKLTSEDGKQAVQVLTVRLEMTADDKRPFGLAMNSDPYWHHFRERRITLGVGPVRVVSGPRILVERAAPPFLAAPTEYVVTFVVPACTKLAGSRLAFFREQEPAAAAKPFAELDVPEKDLAAAARPVRLSVRSADALDREPAAKYRATHVVCVRTDPYLELDGVRLGKLASVDHAPFLTANGKRRSLEPADAMLLFDGAPDPNAEVCLRLKGVGGWFPCEPWRVTDRPAPPTALK